MKICVLNEIQMRKIEFRDIKLKNNFANYNFFLIEIFVLLKLKFIIA